MLEIAPEKVAHIIIKAREYGSKVAAWDESQQASGAEDDPASILEDFRNDPTRRELASFVNALNADEQAHLVALMWIGRGTFGPDELDEAVETARTERHNAIANYLTGIPLLADYLEEGLEKFGIPVEATEGDIL